MGRGKSRVSFENGGEFMKKRLGLAALALIMAGAMVFARGTGDRQQARTTTQQRDWKVNGPYHIGVITGTVSQSEDDLRGAEELIKRYGRVSEGGIIQHVTYPDNFMDQQEVVISQALTLADDPLMKAIVWNQAVPGSGEAYRRIRERRPDILLIQGEPHEDVLVAQSVSDIVVQSDFIPGATPSSGPPSSWGPIPLYISPSPGTCPTRPWGFAGRSSRRPARTWA
jgi:hypothetical protein